MVHIQVMRKGKKPCHLAPIIMFLYSEHNAELISVSMDGAIKFWYYRTVDAADPPEKDRVLEMEPSFAITVRDAVGVAKIMGMCKINNKPDSYDYFVQVTLPTDGKSMTFYIYFWQTRIQGYLT